ncbi:MAG TPA: hypothetical protein VFA26_04915, partial [Gemmataceae bacterium]|nr:hypothetical protein [Gemmataceae bacterium]
MTVRYAIGAARNERAPQYRAMLAFFKKHGFTRDEENVPEDEEESAAYDTLSGTVPSAEARALLAERHVRALRLVPAGTKLPAADNPVRVQLELADGPLLEPGRYLYGTAAARQAEFDGGARLRGQQVLAGQVLAVLAKLNFSEAVGYDNRAHTRLLGTIAAGRLGALLDDLRRQPAAWQLPNDPPVDSVLLAGLRRRPGGEAVLDGILADWDGYFERKRRESEAAPADKPGQAPYRKEDDVIAKLVAAWARQPAGAAYLKSLPPEVQASETITRGLLRAQLVGQPEASGVLQTAWRDALANPFAPDLLALLLRRLPPAVLGDLPLLLRTDSAVRVTEVQTYLPAPAARPAPAEPARADEKLSADLRALLGGPEAGQPRRLEVILTLTPDDADRTWRRELVGAAPGLVVEGRVGPLVSVLVPPERVRPRNDEQGRWTGLAALPLVSAVRLPRSGEPRSLGAAEKVDTAQALKSTGLDRLHQANYKGQGVLVAVIDGDFRGWQGLVGKGLPARTRFLDLTAERNADLLPDAPPGGAGVGHGTQMALAAAVAAPEAEMVLVRIDPAAPYQLLTVARAMNGEAPHSLNLARRADDLEDMRADVEARRSDLRKTRAAQMQKAPDVTQKPLLLKKKEKKTLTADEEDLLKDIEEFEAYQKEQARLDADEREYQQRVTRYLRLEEDLRGLRRVRVVANGLSWLTGMPVDGGGALSRYFDDEPFRKALWFQAAGETRGQTW